MPRISFLVPVFPVADAARAFAFYSRLGFAKNWEHTVEPGAARFGSISREEVTIFLMERPAPTAPVLAYVTVDDVDALARELRGFGAPVQGPIDQPWGIREIHLCDPDGNELRIGQRTGPLGEG